MSDDLVGVTHLAGASLGRHEAVAGAEAGAADGADGAEVGVGVVVADGAQDGAEGQVSVRGVGDVHGDAHGGRADEEGEVVAVGGDDEGEADGELAVVFGEDALADAALDVPAEALAQDEVEAAVHEAEAVGGADDGVCAA